MSLLTGDDFEDEEIEHEKVKQAFQQGKFFSNFQAEIFSRYQESLLGTP